MIDESIYFVRGLPCKKEIWRELILRLDKFFIFAGEVFVDCVNLKFLTGVYFYATGDKREYTILFVQ